MNRSQTFFFDILPDLVTDKKVLDYGCGDGLHTEFLEKYAQEVIGIDNYEPFLKQGILMDCEAMTFEDSSFDVVVSIGTFAALNFEKAIHEIKRVLRPQGILVAIETFGHNPLWKLKTALKKSHHVENSYDHVMTTKDVKLLKEHFKTDIHYFELIPGILYKEITFLKKYAFKIVFICQQKKLSYKK